MRQENPEALCAGQLGTDSVKAADPGLPGGEATGVRCAHSRTTAARDEQSCTREAEGTRPANVRRRTEGSATHVNKAGQYTANDGRHERQTEGVGTRPSPTARAALWQSASLAEGGRARL